VKQYYEAHVTMLGEPSKVELLVKALGWKFSAIDGDDNPGDGIKCYATRQFNKRLGEGFVVDTLLLTATALQERGHTVLRRKVELVVFDDRSKAVQEACNGACLECV